MDSNYGLLSGIGQGLSQGVQSFIDNTRYQDEQARKQKDDALKNALTKLQLKQSGYDFNPDTNDLSQTEQGAQQEQLKTAQTTKSLAESDPNSAESKSTRDYYRGLIKSANPRANTNQIVPETMSAADLKSKEGLLPEYVKGAFGVQERQTTNDRVLGKQTNQNNTKLGDAIDENKGRSGELGRQVQFANNADRALVLGKQFSDGNLPPAQMAELATSVGALLAGSGHAAEGTISRFVPSTASGSVAQIQQWLTSEPKGAGQQAFVRQLLDTAQRERDLALDKVKGVKFGRVAQFNVDPTDPQVAAILKSHGVDPDEYQEYVKGGYKMPAAAAKQQTGQGLLNGSQSKPKTVIQNGHTYTLNPQTGQYE